MIEHLPYLLTGFLCAMIPSFILFILLYARRRSYEMLYRRALTEYARLCKDYIDLLSCVNTGFIPKRLLNRRPSVKEIFQLTKETRYDAR